MDRKTPTLLILAALLVFIGQGDSLQWHRYPSPWTWECQNQVCVKKERTDALQYTSLATCKMTCGQFGALWPRPRGKTILGSQVAPFLPKNVIFGSTSAPDTNVLKLINQAKVIFMQELQKMHPRYGEVEQSDLFTGSDFEGAVATNIVNISLSVVWPDDSLTLQTDESYTLAVKTLEEEMSVVILANTFFGARHALETLTQLIDYDDEHYSLQILTSAIITDKPAYPYRAISLDTARNYITLPAIRRTIDAMSYNKLNVLHWHITDTQSFPFYSVREPKLALYGAYSPLKVYLPSQIQELVEYARVRGVRIIPEFDAPSHIGAGWQWGPKEGKGDLVVCLNWQPWSRYGAEPPTGQFNLANPNVYPILGDIYKDLFDAFDINGLFHMGGDEINYNCWNETKSIIDYVRSKGWSTNQDGFMNLWNEFQTKAYELVKEANGGNDLNITLWTSDLTTKNYASKFLDPSRYIIQIWTEGKDPMVADLIDAGFRVIFSNYDALYLDCGFSSWVGEGNNWCSPYKGWQLAYNNNMLQILASFNRPGLVERAVDKHLVLGASAGMWTEQVDEMALDAKLWPRSAAMAERLWADPIGTWREAETRMVHHRERLAQRGIGTDALQPEWCHQNEGYC